MSLAESLLNILSVSNLVEINLYEIILQGSKEDVVELTDANFEREVLNSKDLVLVEFFAPW